LVSLAVARSRIDQALDEIAATGLIGGLTCARMSAFTGIPEDDMIERIENHHCIMDY
jgi:hypothetical protein